MFGNWKNEQLEHVMDDDQEVFETLVFNLPGCVNMEYDEMMHHRKRVSKLPAGYPGRVLHGQG